MVSLFDLVAPVVPPPAEYLSQVAQVKRFLEAFIGDDQFREKFLDDSPGVLEDRGITDVSRADLQVCLKADTRLLTIQALLNGQAPDPKVPDALAKYCAFVAEKFRWRDAVFRDSEPADMNLKVWRERQINRCLIQFGAANAAGLVHSPLAIELSKGCTVGCWFCGLGAEKYQGYFPYTDDNAVLWRECLEVLRHVIGPAAGQGVLYWATEPFDNPDYELFMADYHAAMGRWPQTTTAMATKDLGRTRNLLRLARMHNGMIDRFSILSVGQLRQVHSSFTPEELLLVECITQNKEAGMLKVRSGRAAQATEARSKLVVDRNAPGASSIACISGFLLNMVDKRVQMITPCDADNNWPLGYWVLDEMSFSDACSLEKALRMMIDQRCQPELKPDRHLTVYPEIVVDSLKPENALVLRAELTTTEVKCGGIDSDVMADIFASRTCTLESVARQIEVQPELLSAVAVARKMYRRGLFDEDPKRGV